MTHSLNGDPSRTRAVLIPLMMAILILSHSLLLHLSPGILDRTPIWFLLRGNKILGYSLDIDGILLEVSEDVPISW